MNRTRARISLPWQVAFGWLVESAFHHKPLSYSGIIDSDSSF